ncbi:Cytoplasmic dynein 2 heavy chain 1 [Ameca splendens]|uniref:Cytoplasmic dynein 2 heavy chain 1 n=1 Tax=Ameca splendens TaxID=208324 RepID=A0ABV0XDV4_9TELE
MEWEPVLIIISPGADPSQELKELAAETIGRDKYHEISMGQGQADVALATLRKCSLDGDWLCLKNLHLVTAWLPLLEKVGTLCVCSVCGGKGIRTVVNIC